MDMITVDLTPRPKRVWAVVTLLGPLDQRRSAAIDGIGAAGTGGL
jgi:hypothetical protein